jgi:hypothetical protein
VYTLHDDNSPRTSIVLRLSCPLTVGSRDGNAVHRIILLEHRLRTVGVGDVDAVQRASYRTSERLCVTAKQHVCICNSTHQKPFTRSPPAIRASICSLSSRCTCMETKVIPRTAALAASSSRAFRVQTNPLTNSSGRGFVTAKACICVSLVKGCQHIKRRTGQAVVTPMGSDS